MNKDFSLKQHCHVNTNNDSDQFVGIQVTAEKVQISFPAGYELSDSEDGIRNDILNLIDILTEFKTDNSNIDFSGDNTFSLVDFPVHSYLFLIRDFLMTGHYYMKTTPISKTDIKGQIQWNKTFQNQHPYIQDDTDLIYTKFTVRNSITNDTNILSLIHQYCVHQSFSILGWLYVNFIPPAPVYKISNNEALSIINKQISKTHKDKDLQLLFSMKSVLSSQNGKTNRSISYYGVNKFHVIWENLIDRAFGITNKAEYYPHTCWLFNPGIRKNNHPLIPDSIMLLDDKCYILDAKYYRYGITGDPNHAPDSSDINKQVTYGDNIHATKPFDNAHLYNCFILPFNRNNNPFHLTKNINNVGEARCLWRETKMNYERIQCVLCDVKFLMHNYANMPHIQKEILASTIEISSRTI